MPSLCQVLELVFDIPISGAPLQRTRRHKTFLGCIEEPGLVVADITSLYIPLNRTQSIAQFNCGGGWER